MQAIILAAGMGRRLGKYTSDNTKCMLSVNGVRLIDRMLGQLSNLELSRVLIVVGYKGEKLKDYIGTRYDDRLKIEFAENPVYDRQTTQLSVSSSSLGKSYTFDVTVEVDGTITVEDASKK